MKLLRKWHILSFLLLSFALLTATAHAATYYMDYANGSDANNGSSWALAKKTINGYTAAILVAGDTIRIAKSPDPTSLGITATWTNASKTVSLGSVLNGTVDMCETAWTASANVTSTANSGTKKQANFSASLAIAAGFTTGVAAYKTITSTDYSGYQQLSFWIRSSAQVNSGVLRIDLCSDTAGATPVDSFTINTTLYANQFYPLTIDKGSALGSAIQSVALYCISDPGTPTILLDNIITVKASSSADALSLTSFIGKNTAGESWYPIQAIYSATVLIDNGPNTASTSGKGYSGTTETVTTYKRETIKTTPVSASSTAVQTVQDSGTSGSLITFSGGWNTGTTTQDGETWFDGQNGLGYGIYLNIKSYVKLEKIGVVRCYAGVYNFNSSTFNTFTSLSLISNAAYGFFVGAGPNTLSSINANNNDSYGFYITSHNGNISSSLTSNNTSNGIYLNASGNTFTSITSKNNGTNDVSLSHGISNAFVSCSFGSSGIYSILVGGYTQLYLFNCLFSTATELTASSSAFESSYVYSYRHNQTQNRFKTWDFYSSGGISGMISDQITGGQTAAWARGGSGICVYLNPSSTTSGRTVDWEFWIPVTASTSTTLSFYHKITTAFNGSLTVTVYDSDDDETKLIDAASVTLTDNGDWNAYTSSSFTPTDTGFCRVVLKALDGTTTGDIGIDDITISPDPDVNQGAMDRWMQGLPPEFMTNATATGPAATEQSYGYVN